MPINRWEDYIFLILLVRELTLLEPINQADLIQEILGGQEVILINDVITV